MNINNNSTYGKFAAKPAARVLQSAWMKISVPPKRKLLTALVGFAIQQWSNK